MKERIQFLINGPESSSHQIVLAHGAGVSMDAPFLDYIARGLAEENLCVHRFEFPYMQKIRKTGVRRSPDSEHVLSRYWLRVIEEIGHVTDLIIGGKSLGGRIASMIADDAGVRGFVCLGYPFHPPGKPERLRTAHLIDIKTPALVLQGTRDAFGTREEVVKYGLSRQIRLVFIEDGDHSFKPRARSGRTEKQNLDQVISEISGFVKSI